MTKYFKSNVDKWQAKRIFPGQKKPSPGSFVPEDGSILPQVGIQT
jgi:hypothetical protein